MPRPPAFCPHCAAPLRRQRAAHNAELRHTCLACGWIHYDNPAPCAGVVVVNAAGQVLLGRRKFNPLRGYWNIIGGFVEGSEHPEESARREAQEETGLIVELDRLLGIWMDRYGKSRENTMNLIYLGHPVGGREQAGDDIAELRWFDADALPPKVAFLNGRLALQRWMEQRGTRGG